MQPTTLYTAKALEEPLTLAYVDVVSALENGTIQDELGLMRWGSNYTFLVTVCQNDNQFLAIYKPQVGERPLWDFPDGTLYQREVAAYLLSQQLGWYLVPPTIAHNGPRGIGSVQAFIEHDPQQHYFTLDESHEPQLRRMALFDVLANNADRKGGHCLKDAESRLWGIDHGLTFHSMYKLRTVIWDYAGQSIHADLLNDLQHLAEALNTATSDFRTQLAELLSEHEIQALNTRTQRLLNTKIYPQPGAGPNRPWPSI